MKSYLSRRLSRGFTVIELLIVILIIGILATLVLVAYRGITASAADRSVQSDLDGLDGIETDYGTKNNVPGKAWYSGSGIDSSLNFTPSAGNIIDVVINSTDYCIRGYNPNAATYKTLATAAIKESTPGICTTLNPSSQATAISNGIAYLTNLILNPSVENGTLTPNAAYFSAPISVDATRALYGSSSIKTVTNSATNKQGVIWYTDNSITPGSVYTCSVYVTGSSGTTLYVAGRANSSVGYIGEGYGSQLIGLSASWQRVTVSFTAPANTQQIGIEYILNTAASGITFWGDGAICTQGSQTYNYGDGSSTGWVWNGTANNSTSSGPAL